MRVLVSGVTGQIGWYAAEQAVAAGHEVYGLVRGQGTPDVPRGVTVLRGDLSDQASLIHAVREAKPDHVYNLGAFTSIGSSWSWPELCMDVTGLGVLRLLEAVRLEAPQASVVQASSADQFGEGDALGLQVPFQPRSPYSVAKQVAHDICNTYRKAYGLKVSCAVQFNAVSPRLREEFFLRKVTKAVARISVGLQDKLYVGDLSPIREVGCAKQVAQAYFLIAEYANTHGARDWSLARGNAMPLADIVEYLFLDAGLELKPYLKVHPLNYSRPTDVRVRQGEPDGDLQRLAFWNAPRPISSILREMLNADLADARKEVQR